MEIDAAASTAPHDVWAAGKGAGAALVLHWDGTAWTPSETGPTGAQFLGAAALSTTDAWVVGTTADQRKMLIEHWNGTQWSKI